MPTKPTKKPDQEADIENAGEGEDQDPALLELVAKAVREAVTPYVKKVNGELARNRRAIAALRTGAADSGAETDDREEEVDDGAGDAEDTPPAKRRKPSGRDELDPELLLELGELRGKLPASVRKRLSDALGDNASLREELAAARGAALQLEESPPADRGERRSHVSPKRTGRTDVSAERSGVSRPNTFKEWLAMEPAERNKLITDDSFDPTTLPSE